MTAHPVIRNLHDLGLAAWTGGSLMGAVGLNGAAAALDDPRQRARASTAGWTRWAPVNAAAIGAHLIGAAGLLYTDSSRVASQRGVGTSSALKTVATAAGLGVAGWSAVLNRKMVAAGPVPVAGATEAGPGTPADVAKTLRQLKLVQWLNPAVGFALVALSSWQSEQQRPTEVVKGTLQKAVGGLTGPVGIGALAGTTAVVAGLATRRKGSSTTRTTTAPPVRSTPPVSTLPPVTTPPVGQDTVAIEVVEVDVIDLNGQNAPAGTTGTPVRPVD
jgi:hypothetical protein